jgi:transcription initiation factor TFIIIB Brf1 subunit/transcription initiation factor TFIIB
MTDTPSCGDCGSTNGYVRIETNEFVCRKCGQVTKLKERKK